MLEYTVAVHTFSDTSVSLLEAEEKLLNEKAGEGWEHYDTSLTPIGYKGSMFGFIYRFRRPKKGDGKPVLV